MVNCDAALLGACRWTSNYVDNWNMFGIGSGQGVDGRKLANTKGGDNSANALNPRISIGSVACN